MDCVCFCSYYVFPSLVIYRYANKGSIMKAITDFELALENCPDHRNAKKYLCQTLVERGKQ